MSKLTTISQNNLTIAENELKVFEAGQKSMVDESKFIEATATGESILLLDDVSEIPHEVDVRVWSKNLFNPLTSLDGKEFERDGGYRVNAQWFVTDYIAIKENTDYVVSGKPEGSVVIFYDENKNIVNSINKGANQSFCSPSGAVYARLNGKLNSKSTFQIEEGTEATPYVPYVDVSGATVDVYGKNILNLNHTSGDVSDLYRGWLVNPTNRNVTLSLTDNDTTVDISDIYFGFTTNGVNGNETYKWIIVNGNISAMQVTNTLKYISLFPNKDETLRRLMSRFHIQAEYGIVASEYEPCIKNTLSLDEEGKAKTKSISPYMKFASSVIGAQVTSEYHKSWGMQTEWDRFWDTYQNYGNRVHYASAFSYDWNDKTFKPKYNIVLGGDYSNYAADNMFYQTKIVDLVGCLKKQGVTIDFTNCTRLSGTFDRSDYLTTIPHINAVNCISFIMTFNSSRKIKIIEISNIKEACTFDRVFNTVSYLEELKLNNCIIGQNGFNVQWSTKLSRESIIGIINALSTTTSGLTVTLSKTAVNTAFETSVGAGDGSTSSEWLNLIATRNNWTISLV